MKRLLYKKVAMSFGLIFLILAVCHLSACKTQTKSFFSAHSSRMRFLLPAPPFAYEAKETDHAEISHSEERLYDQAFEQHFLPVSAMVTDGEGRVLYEKNIHESVYPASTTKLMTAMVALDHTQDLDALITVDTLEGCYEYDSILMYIEPGDRISMRDLLYALLMKSCNDAGTAIAMEIGGSLEGFYDLMNQKAATLGCQDYHFASPHGLYDPDHYMSAYDLNLIMRAAYSYETIREIFLEDSYYAEYYREEDEYFLLLENNAFFYTGVYEVPGMTFLGGKTGFIEESRSSYASVFEKEGELYYVSVVSSCDSPYMTALLLDYLTSKESMLPLLERVPVIASWYGYTDY